MCCKTMLSKSWPFSETCMHTKVSNIFSIYIPKYINASIVSII